MLMRIRLTTWAWIAVLIVFAAFLSVPADRRFPGAVVSAFTFAAALARFPRCRHILEAPICPWNWALLAFAMQLVVMPLWITLEGPGIGVLPYLPSHSAINFAMVLNCIAFIATCSIYSYLGTYRGSNGVLLKQLRKVKDIQRDGSGRLTIIYALLGISGVVLSFGDVAGIAGYFNDPAYYRELLLDASSTWRGLGALLLKPFLGFVVIMSWCKWIDSRGRNASWLRRSLVTALMLVGVVLSFGTLSYNRGVFVVPVVAAATVALVNGDKVSWRLMILGGLLLLMLMPAYAVYRSGKETGADFLGKLDLDALSIEKTALSESVQMYAGAPQYLGFLMDKSQWGGDPHWGGVTISSVLSPVPVVGKIFRRQSGFAIYNRLIYGTDSIADQNAPFVGETFLDFHVVGVFLGALLVGWALHRLQVNFEGSRSSLEIYIWQYISVWVCFLIFGSIGVLSQILLYSCWPIYAFWYLNRKPWPVVGHRGVTMQEG